MKKLTFFFTLLIIYCSLFIGTATAQWWTSGGNLLWPYGNVRINKGLSAGDDLKYNYETNFSETIRANHHFLASQETWYGGSLFANFDDGTNIIKKIQPGSRMNGIDNFVWQKNNDTVFNSTGMQTQIRWEPKAGSVYRDSWPQANSVWSYLVLGKLPYKSNFATGNLGIYEAVIDETPSVTAIDTIPFNNVYAYHFRFGDGNKHRYPVFYTFYSDLTTYNAGTKILTGYHFYGSGDYPSYFGGVIRAKQFQLNALNTAPANATATGTAGEIRVDANYIYICVATNTWKRVAIATW